jgi:hypothetical protein
MVCWWVLVHSGPNTRVRETHTHTYTLTWINNSVVQSRVSSDSNWTLNEVETMTDVRWANQTKPKKKQKKAPKVYFRVLLYYSLYEAPPLFLFFLILKLRLLCKRGEGGGWWAIVLVSSWASCCFPIFWKKKKKIPNLTSVSLFRVTQVRKYRYFVCFVCRTQ